MTFDGPIRQLHVVIATGTVESRLTSTTEREGIAPAVSPSQTLLHDSRRRTEAVQRSTCEACLKTCPRH
ncbi:hypothetical protein WJX79_002734 [Trebouxia sp. C0005]